MLRAVILNEYMELIFEVRDAEDGGFYARALGHAIFTEAETWEELRANVLEAASLHFEDSPVQPRLVQLHYVKERGRAKAISLASAGRDFPCTEPRAFRFLGGRL